MGNRIPLAEEPIADMAAVVQYDKGARYYIMPEYKYFVGKILRKGIKNGRVLDIGTGSGRLAIELAKAKGGQFDIIALDISKNMIIKARENARHYGVENKIQFLVATATALPFPDKSFDLVIAGYKGKGINSAVNVFNEVARLIKGNGRAIIRDNKRVYQNPVWKAAIWLVSRFMNKRHRENWPKAILASYTTSEVREILSKSRLKN